jgi:hypothetical protein
MNIPAFPRPSSPAHEYGFHKHQDGMTLRDYFASKAMVGFIAYATHKGINIPSDDELAGSSYQLADAMMKAREA